MRRFICPLILAFFCCVAALPTFAQNEESKEETKAPNKAKLSQEDIAYFEPLLRAYLDAEGRADIAEAKASILQAMDDYAEKNKVSSPVADYQAWVDMFGRYNKETFTRKKVYATGRIKTEQFVLSRNGDHYLYEYSVFVPRDYDPAKSWPVLLCLHDKEAKGLGKGYIQKVWQGTKESKLLCENFIIIVPHIPKKLLKKKIKVTIAGKKTSVKSTVKRLDWFNSYHLWAMVLPLVEMRKNYNCDPTRIFIEGVGDGADAALSLAAMMPGRFAGVIARHGKLRTPRLLTGLQHTPTLILAREEGKFAKGPGKEFLEIANEATKGDVQYDSLEVVKFPSLGKKKISLKKLANQKVDPILEANEQIATYLTKHVLDPNPKKVRITSNNRVFRLHPLLKVTEHDIAAGNILDCIATFDKEKNTVELTGENFYGVSLFISDAVLDLSKPVQVLVNGRQVDARIPDRNAAKMLSTFRNAKTDFHRAMTCNIVVPRFTLEVEEDEKKEGEKKAGEKESGEKN